MPESNHIIRIITATSLFDGHDAAINIMRRILQSKGAEVIHLGHNRSVHEIVEAALEEDAQAIAVTSYQGGHLEFFKYMYDLLQQNGGSHIKIFGGGGGTILPKEIEALHQYGITKIYSPDDGRKMGLEGMIDDLLSLAKKKSGNEKEKKILNRTKKNYALGESKNILAIAKAISTAEKNIGNKQTASNQQPTTNNQQAIVGITGTGGSGKSSVTDEMVRRFLQTFPKKTIAVVSVDPSRKKTGGALLGDRIRMNSISGPRVYMRSLATRNNDKALSAAMHEALEVVRAAGFDLIIIESAGVGQSDASILDYCDVSLYVMTPEYGAASQLEKINMLDYADIIAINKFDKAGALDALHEVRKQYKRNHGLWNAANDELPVIGTIASQFNEAGANHLFELLLQKIDEKYNTAFAKKYNAASQKNIEEKNAAIIPAKRIRYLSEIAESIREYDEWAKEQREIASTLYQLNGVIDLLKKYNPDENT